MTRPMNRHSLLELVRQQLGGTATPMAAQLALHAVLRGIRDGLNQDGEVRLAGFGTFRVQQRAPRRLLLPGYPGQHETPGSQSRDVLPVSCRQAAPRLLTRSMQTPSRQCGMV